MNQCCFQSAKSLAIDELGFRRAILPHKEFGGSCYQSPSLDSTPIENEKIRALGSLNFFLLCFQGCIHSMYPEPSHKLIQSKVEDVLYLRARIQNFECDKLLNHLIDVGGLFNIAHH
jgi:hypothetical protein